MIKEKSIFEIINYIIIIGLSIFIGYILGVKYG